MSVTYVSEDGCSRGDGELIVAARKVLSDCELVFELLEREENPDLWRVQWAGGLALLRAVGHVLDNVDGKQSKTLKASIKARYELWMRHPDSHPIFHQFIKRERDLILKEYEFNAQIVARPGLTVSGPNSLNVDFFGIDGDLFRPVLDGPYAGEDARDIYRGAIDWWTHELNTIEKYCRQSDS